VRIGKSRRTRLLRGAGSSVSNAFAAEASHQRWDSVALSPDNACASRAKASAFAAVANRARSGGLEEADLGEEFS